MKKILLFTALLILAGCAPKPPAEPPPAAKEKQPGNDDKPIIVENSGGNPQVPPDKKNAARRGAIKVRHEAWSGASHDYVEIPNHHVDSFEFAGHPSVVVPLAGKNWKAVYFTLFPMGGLPVVTLSSDASGRRIDVKYLPAHGPAGDSEILSTVSFQRVVLSVNGRPETFPASGSSPLEPYVTCLHYVCDKESSDMTCKPITVCK